MVVASVVLLTARELAQASTAIDVPPCTAFSQPAFASVWHAPSCSLQSLRCLHSSRAPSFPVRRPQVFVRGSNSGELQTTPSEPKARGPGAIARTGMTTKLEGTYLLNKSELNSSAVSLASPSPLTAIRDRGDAGPPVEVFATGRCSALTYRHTGSAPYQ